MSWTTPTVRTTGDLITASIYNTDLVNNLIALRAGGVAIASQAALDLITGASATQLARTAAGTALQVPRINAAGNGWEFASPTALNDIGGRLTLETLVAVSTTDQSAKTTLYYTPYIHNQIALYDGSANWNVRSFSEISITLVGLTASKPYDVFCYDNAGTATLELLVWTSATARATALVKQDGRWVKTGATTRRYLGTIYINASGGQSDDTYAKRYVWNANNRVVRPMRVLEATDTWTYGSAAFRQANGSTANQLDVVVGLPDVGVNARVLHIISGATLQYAVGIGLDSTTAIAAGSLAELGIAQAQESALTAEFLGYPGIGRHTITWLERAFAAGSITSSGDGGVAYEQSGICGSIEG